MFRIGSSGSVLDPDRLNVVGESHSQSNARRPEEQQFVHEVLGTHNYWTEADFPDLHTRIGAREKPDQDRQDGADLMEYRAVHGASILINESGKLAETARKISTLRTDHLPPEKTETFNRLVARFDQSVADFRKVADRVERSVETTATAEVNKVVEAVFQRVQNTCDAYGSAPRATPPELRTAAENVATSLGDLPKVLPLLGKVVGVTPSPDGQDDSLAETMRTRRSTFMGLAAVFSQQVGVWKVGNAHVEDLLSGRSKVDMSRANFVTQETFNNEFESWQRGRHRPN